MDKNWEIKSSANIKALINYNTSLKELAKATQEFSSGNSDLNYDQLEAIRNSCNNEMKVWKYISELIKKDIGKNGDSVLENLLK